MGGLFQGCDDSKTGLSAMFEGTCLDNTPAGARLDLAQFSQGTAHQPCRALQFSSQQFSQASVFAASQELGYASTLSTFFLQLSVDERSRTCRTQDFATPSHDKKRAQPSQLASQPMVAPALGQPPPCDMKRGRVESEKGVK